MSFTLSDLPDLTGQTAVVTGANSGLGFKTAQALAGAGAHVVMTARSEEKYDAAAAELRARNRRAELSFQQLDLADLASVRAAAEAIAEAHPDLAILVNNAGVMMTPEKQTADGFELQLGTNHLGHFALTGLLLEALLAGEGARVTNVSSFAHHTGRMAFDDLHFRTRSYDPIAAYGQSKLANLLFTFELQRRLDAAVALIRVTAAHPGYAATNLQASGVRMGGGGWRSTALDLFMRLSNPLMGQSAAQGALPIIHAAVSDVPASSYWGPQGFQETRGPVGMARVDDKALDADAARRLWEVSVEETGVRYEALTAPTDA
ncbi:MAG: oxidoreductase [Egibacteraceae bacterium]